MNSTRLLMLAAAALALNTPVASKSHAGLFKIDFGHMENERIPLDPDGNELPAPAKLVEWTVLPTWTFLAPNDLVTEGSASAIGTANAEGTEVTWPLIDASSNPKAGVTITIMDNKPLAESLNSEAPPYMQGMTANNPTKEGIDVVYDGVRVPYVVKDDYNYRLPDAAGSESLMRIAISIPARTT